MAPRPTISEAPGAAVDADGRAVVDPTKNVLDLVRAQDHHQNEMRGALKELALSKIDGVKDALNLLADGIVQYQNGQRESETRRIDQLAQTRQEFQNTIRDMLAESVRTTSNLVASQLAQIQATFDTRVSKLEAGAFTQAGKSSVSDPATADALTTMARAVQTLTTTSAGDTARQARTTETKTDNRAIIAIVLSAVGVMVVLVIGIVGLLLRR